MSDARRPSLGFVALEQLRRTADTLARAGRTQEALTRYHELVREYAARGRTARAIAVFQSILALDDGSGVTQLALAELFAAPRPTPGDDRVATTPLFAPLGRDALTSIVATLERRPFFTGDTIVREGDAGDEMFVIAEGAVQVVRGTGKEARAVDEMDEGDFFGEMALLGPGPRLATIVASTDGELLVMSRDRYREIARAHPSVAAVAERFYKQRLLTNLVRANAIFGLLTDDMRERLVEVLRIQSHGAGVTLLEAGKPGRDLYVLLRGSCGVFHVHEEGRESQHPPLEEGDVFGEISLLHDGLATATVRTLSPCVLLELKREWFDELLLANPEVRDAIYAVAGERTQRTRDVVARETIQRRIV